MGRELRRVPLTFDWPLQKIWKGFLNPHFRPCPKTESGECQNGYSAAGKWFHAVARLIVMLGDEAVEAAPERRERHKRTGRIYPHPYLREWALAPTTDLPRAVREKFVDLEGAERRHAVDEAWRRHPPTPLPLTEELLQFVRGLAPQEDRLIGHFDDYAIEQSLRKAAKLGKKWGICPVCDGTGCDPEAFAAWDGWKSEDPPTGEGWQLWETVTEGSPISPVLPTREAFVDWLVRDGYSRGAAEAFAESGWAASGLIVDGKLYENIESCGVK